MKVFGTTLANGYEMVICGGYDHMRAIADLDGTPRKDNWTPPSVQRVRPHKRSGNKPAELPHMGNTFIMRQSAVDALRDVLDAHGEVLPLATEDDVKLFVLNPLIVLDALDMERTEIKHIEGTKIRLIETPAFIESAIPNEVEIFRVPFDRKEMYFTDRFVARVKAAKLKGTDFVPKWSSE